MLQKILRRSFIPLLLAIFIVSPFHWACEEIPDLVVDDTQTALDVLHQKRELALKNLDKKTSAKEIDTLIELGAWDDARRYLAKLEPSSEERLFLEAKLDFKNHNYEKAEKLVDEILDINSANENAKLLRAELFIQAWELEKAERIADKILDENKNNASAGIIKGKIQLLNRNYDAATDWAKMVQKWDPKLADGYLLEAESLFWDQKPNSAEQALTKAIELNPFDADARYSYGYAVWRRVDATQLDNMAAQWNLALEINPLHYLTHWHFGNGHTNLTYADYARESDDKVREELEQVESLIKNDKLSEAINLTLDIENKYQDSVLPQMARGSIFYMFYDMNREERLDSAQTNFVSILDKKQNYGPAHNALAAVIKQRQFQYLDGFEELEQMIANTALPANDEVFNRVFQDAKYYSGTRVEKMIAQQIGPSIAYLEMIDKFNSKFAIPPLHIDLAQAMNNNFFRYGTTFDNRQWMDIRGVGSGATGIEYLERGAHLERNVLAHEYAHLYHGTILTDQESRKIRELYHNAMKGGYALDYYASNNESEYFAQGYAGFLSDKKVHPLNHKSMNTKEYIQQKDPDLYNFLEELAGKQNDYLAGNKDALADNWAQTYLSLAKRARNRGNHALTKDYLNKSLEYNENYVPALLEFAQLNIDLREYKNADYYISIAKNIAENYAPIYLMEASILHHNALDGIIDFEQSLQEQELLFEKARILEEDLAEKASMNLVNRSRYFDYGHYVRAIEIAQRYLKDAPTISTYLRDRRDDTEAFYNNIRSLMGHSGEVENFFKNLIEQKPQNFGHRLTYADVLMRQQKWSAALDVLEEGEKILSSAGNNFPGYTLRIASVYAENGNEPKAEQLLSKLDTNRLSWQDKLYYAEILTEIGLDRKALEILDTLTDLKLPRQIAEFAYVQGLIYLKNDEFTNAENSFKEALLFNKYQLKARVRVVEMLVKMDRNEEADELRKEGLSFKIPLGPDFRNNFN